MSEGKPSRHFRLFFSCHPCQFALWDAFFCNNLVYLFGYTEIQIESGTLQWGYRIVRFLQDRRINSYVFIVAHKLTLSVCSKIFSVAFLIFLKINIAKIINNLIRLTYMWNFLLLKLIMKPKTWNWDIPIDIQGLAISVFGITTAKIAVFLIRQL